MTNAPYNSKIHGLCSNNGNAEVQLEVVCQKGRIPISGSRWPHIYPTSCISFRRNFFNKFIRYSRCNDFKNLGIDARLIIFAKYFCNDYNIINKKLNNYTISKTGNYSKYGHLGKNWWISRNEAFEYLKYILKLKNIKFIKTIDYYLTKIIYNIIKISL